MAPVPPLAPGRSKLISMTCSSNWEYILFVQISCDSSTLFAMWQLENAPLLQLLFHRQQTHQSHFDLIHEADPFLFTILETCCVLPPALLTGGNGAQACLPCCPICLLRAAQFRRESRYCRGCGCGYDFDFSISHCNWSHSAGRHPSTKICTTEQALFARHSLRDSR